jgi:acyl dehydratase
MTIDPQVVGQSTAPQLHRYTWKDVVLYALGVGARADELDYLYEGRGPKVLPTFAVVPAYFANMAAMAAIGGDLASIVHVGQVVRLTAPIPPRGTLSTVATVTALYDLLRMAQVIVSTRTTDEAGRLLFETEWSIVHRGAGGFGGQRPPEIRRATPPRRDADFRMEEATAQTQALLYRLSGDENPLHADPSLAKGVGFDGPILHGLCTYGYVGRAVVKMLCGGQGDRLRSLSARFRKPVLPGETLITEGWMIEPTKAVIRCTAKERNEPVLTDSIAEVTA